MNILEQFEDEESFIQYFEESFGAHSTTVTFSDMKSEPQRFLQQLKESEDVFAALSIILRSSEDASVLRIVLSVLSQVILAHFDSLDEDDREKIDLMIISEITENDSLDVLHKSQLVHLCAKNFYSSICRIVEDVALQSLDGEITDEIEEFFMENDVMFLNDLFHYFYDSCQIDNEKQVVSLIFYKELLKQFQETGFQSGLVHFFCYNYFQKRFLENLTKSLFVNFEIDNSDDISIKELHSNFKLILECLTLIVSWNFDNSAIDGFTVFPQWFKEFFNFELVENLLDFFEQFYFNQFLINSLLNFFIVLIKSCLWIKKDLPGLIRVFVKFISIYFQLGAELLYSDYINICVNIIEIFSYFIRHPKLVINADTGENDLLQFVNLLCEYVTPLMVTMYSNSMNNVDTDLVDTTVRFLNDFVCFYGDYCSSSNELYDFARSLFTVRLERLTVTELNDEDEYEDFELQNEQLNLIANVMNIAMTLEPVQTSIMDIISILNDNVEEFGYSVQEQLCYCYDVLCALSAKMKVNDITVDKRAKNRRGSLSSILKKPNNEIIHTSHVSYNTRAQVGPFASPDLNTLDDFKSTLFLEDLFEFENNAYEELSSYLLKKSTQLVVSLSNTLNDDVLIDRFVCILKHTPLCDDTEFQNFNGVNLINCCVKIISNLKKQVLPFDEMFEIICSMDIPKLFVCLVDYIAMFGDFKTVYEFIEYTTSDNFVTDQTISYQLSFFACLDLQDFSEYENDIIELKSQCLQNIFESFQTNLPSLRIIGLFIDSMDRNVLFEGFFDYIVEYFDFVRSDVNRSSSALNYDINCSLNSFVIDISETTITKVLTFFTDQDCEVGQAFIKRNFMSFCQFPSFLLEVYNCMNNFPVENLDSEIIDMILYFVSTDVLSYNSLLFFCNILNGNPELLLIENFLKFVVKSIFFENFSEFEYQYLSEFCLFLIENYDEFFEFLTSLFVVEGYDDDNNNDDVKPIPEQKFEFFINRQKTFIQNNDLHPNSFSTNLLIFVKHVSSYFKSYGNVNAIRLTSQELLDDEDSQ
ncbi:hypothetical protein PCE1_000373 [Barthelona sp. PCE]